MISKFVVCPKCKKKAKLIPIPQIYTETVGGKAQTKVRYMYICQNCEYEWTAKK